MSYNLYFKRAIDCSLSCFTLLFLFPLLLLIMLCIKIFDPGPVLFTQMRAGKDGKVFKLFKFRSMPVNTGDIPSDKVASIQLTWIGKFIRRTNIDELPQLLNILLGEMSIVGPRPSLFSQIALIELRRQNGALSCRPGLTGLAQIRSYDGMSVEAKAALDGEYAQRIGFFTDCSIILRTFTYLVHPPPKY